MTTDAFGRQLPDMPGITWVGGTIDPDALIAQRLMHRVEIIGSLRAHVGAGIRDAAKPGSDLAGDDAVTGPYQGSHHIAHCLMVAADCMTTIELILRDGDSLRIPIVGVYPVVRTALEAATSALWVLIADSPVVRRTRTLRIAMQEAREENSLVREFIQPRTTDPADVKKQKARQLQAHKGKSARMENVLALAAAAGLSEKEVESGVTSIRGLLDDVDAAFPAPLVSWKGLWQYVSGLSHPSALRLFSASDLKLEDTDDPGIMHATVSAKEDMVLMLLDAVMLLIREMTHRFAERAGDPALEWHMGGVSMPPGWVAAGTPAP